MKLRSKAGITLAFLGALVISSSAMAGHHKGEKRLDRMANYLEMDDNQKALMKAVYDEYKPQLMALYQERRDLRKALREAMESGEDVESLAASHGEVTEQLIIMRANMKRGINELLSEEQLTKLQEMREHRKMRGKHRRGHWKKRKQQQQEQQGEAV